MGVSGLFRKSCIAFILLILFACSGGGDSGGSAPVTSPNIHLAQSVYDFGGVVLNSSADKTFEIRNSGNASLRIGQISSSESAFAISGDTCSNTTLAPSAACSLKACFSPALQGSHSAALTIPSNDQDSNVVSIRLNGTGYGLNIWINEIDVVGCLVTAAVTVTNPATTDLLTSLTKDEFILKQNGQIQDVETIQNIYPSNVSIVLALDWSTSTANVVSDIRTAAASFINRLTDGDEVAVSKFNAVIDFYPTAASYYVADAAGKAALISYVDAYYPRVSGTPLYDVIIQSVDRVELGSSGKQRAVIILSDGEDNGSTQTLEQVIAWATQKGIPIFTIYYTDPSFGGGNYGDTEVMQRLARETGGQYYNSADADLTAIFQKISNVLSNKYVMTYTASSCSGTVSLDVRADWNGLYGQASRAVSFP